MTGIEQHIPDLSEKELERLHANAVRLAQSGTPVQRQQAEALLPPVGAALESHRAQRASTQREARRNSARTKATVGHSSKENPDE